VSSSEQETGIQQISAAYDSMNRIATEIASIADKSQGMALELLGQSTKMNQLVCSLSIVIFGQKGAQ